jgi:hypothetical protein
MLKLKSLFCITFFISFSVSVSVSVFARPMEKCAIVEGMWEGPNTASGPWKVGFVVRTLTLNPTTLRWAKDNSADGLRDVMAAKYIAHFTRPTAVIYPVNLYQYDMMKLAFLKSDTRTIICIYKNTEISYPTHYIYLKSSAFPID